MTEWTAKLAIAIAAAAEAGPQTVPEQLLVKLESFESPLGSLVDRDSATEIFASLDDYLGYVHLVRQSRREYSGELAQQTAAVIRWLIAALSAWTPRSDPRRTKLAAIFIVAARLDEEGALWPLLPDKVADNAVLGRGLVEVLSRLQTRLNAPSWSRTPVQDGEELQQFERAEADRDWSTLRFFAERYAYKVASNAVVDQSLRILNRYFPADLVEVSRAVTHLAIAEQFACALPLDETLAMARQWANPFVSFATVCRIFNKFWPVRELTSAQEDALVALLVTVADDPADWVKWMKAFGTNPYLAHQIQRAIGRAFADLGDWAETAYIDSVYLQSSWVGREDVATCLGAFANRVSLERRQAAWRRMFERWSRWNFGEEEGHAAVTAISLSNVDFAIVGYAIEFLSDAEREAYLGRCVDIVGRSEHVWHKSHLDHMRYVYRALSQFQPFAHARGCDADRSKWLWDRHGGYYPDQLDNAFWRTRYNLHNMPERLGAQEA